MAQSGPEHRRVMGALTQTPQGVAALFRLYPDPSSSATPGWLFSHRESLHARLDIHVRSTEAERP